MPGELEVRNVQTKMILGIYRYADRPDASLDVGGGDPAPPRVLPLRRSAGAGRVPVALLADDARRGPFSAERAAVNTRPGAYDREMVAAPWRLRADRDTGVRRGSVSSARSARRRRAPGEDIVKLPGIKLRRRSA